VQGAEDALSNVALIMGSKLDSGVAVACVDGTTHSQERELSREGSDCPLVGSKSEMDVRKDQNADRGPHI
jgi:hypothetical protein